MKTLTKIVATILLLALAVFAQGSNHSVTLSWTWSQGAGDPATGFHVQRASVSGGPYTTVGTLSSPTSMSYVDSSVLGGQTYFYVVTAFNSGGDSAPSNQITCVVPFQAPAAPTGLSGQVK